MAAPTAGADPGARGVAPAAAFLPWLIGSFVVGAALRLYGIPGQILLDDEWHSVRIVVWEGYGYILRHFGVLDHCIPLSLYNRLLKDTVGLSEMGMRLPVLASGLAALVVLPLLARRLAGAATARVFALLLAVSPLHVYFSRYARPYAVSLLLATTALAGFLFWWREGRRRWAAVYCLAGAGAAYFHLACLPLVLAPLPLALVGTVRARTRPEAVRALAGVTIVVCCLGILLALLLGPPWLQDGKAILTKVGRGARIDGASVAGALELLLGTGSRPLLLGLGLVFATGLVSLGRRRPALLVSMLWLGLVQAASFGLAAPAMGETPFVIARYHLWLLPMVLLTLAQGLTAADAALRSRWPAWPSSGSAVPAAALLLALGPLPAAYAMPNAWTNHGVYQHAYRPNVHVPREGLEPARLSPFYEDLRRRPRGTVTVLEAPWHFKWYINPYPYYQRFHRQRMKVGMVTTVATKYLGYGELLPGQQGMALRNALHVADIDRVRALGVDYVVFHRDLGGELRQRPGEPFPDVTPWIAVYRERIGAPVYEDGDIVVFRVD